MGFETQLKSLVYQICQTANEGKDSPFITGRLDNYWNPQQCYCYTTYKRYPAIAIPHRTIDYVTYVNN